VPEPRIGRPETPVILAPPFGLSTLTFRPSLRYSTCLVKLNPFASPYTGELPLVSNTRHAFSMLMFSERVAMASAIPPARMADTEVPLEDLKTPVKRASARIIRTFEEIEVEKRILQEEWYEELECGM